MAPFQKISLFKNILTVTITFLLTITGWAEENKKLVPYREKNKWGYANLEGKVLIKPKFQKTIFFKYYLVYPEENLSFYYGLVKHKGKWGAISQNGDLIVPCNYDSISTGGLSNGNFLINRQQQWGIYKPKQGEILPINFKKQADAIKAVQALDNKNIARESEPWRTTYLKKKIKAWEKKLNKQNGKWFLPGTQTEISLPVNLKKFRDSSWVEDAFIEVKRNNKWGLIDSIGQLLIPFKYDSLILFEKESSWYDFEDNSPRLKAIINKKWGIISATDQEILPFKYEAISEQVAENIINPHYLKDPVFNTCNQKVGIGWVKSNSKWKLLNAKGQQVLTDYDKVSAPQFVWPSGINTVLELPKIYYSVKKNGKIGVVASDWSLEVVPTDYDTVQIAYSQANYDDQNNNIPILVGKNGKFGLILCAKSPTLEKKVLPCVFDSLTPPSHYSLEAGSDDIINGGFWIWGKREGAWNMYSEKGIALLPANVKTITYKHIEPLPVRIRNNINLLAIKINNKWGVMYGGEKQILPFEFDTITYHFEKNSQITTDSIKPNLIAEHTIFAKTSTGWKKYNTAGEETGYIPYEKVEILPLNDSTIIGYKAFTDKGWIILNTAGKKISSVSYQDIIPHSFSGTIDRYYGFAINYEDKNALWIVRYKDKYGIINENGQEIIPCEFTKIEFGYGDFKYAKLWNKNKFGYFNLENGKYYFKEE